LHYLSRKKFLNIHENIHLTHLNIVLNVTLSKSNINEKRDTEGAETRGGDWVIEKEYPALQPTRGSGGVS